MSNLLFVLSKLNSVTGCHGNDYILYSVNEYFLKTFFSNLVGLSEQIGTH